MIDNQYICKSGKNDVAEEIWEGLKMKAWVLHGPGNIRLETVDRPCIGSGEVLVKVEAAGICGSDIPRIYKTGAHVHPLIPGHEFAGVVTETGTDVDVCWQGKRVGVFPLLPCKVCKPCLEKKYEMCRHYDYLGSRRNGGFAEYVAVPADNLVALPQSVSFEEAAMLEPMAVAVHAMRQVWLKGTETIAVCGLGTIGLLLLMFLLEAEGAGYENAENARQLNAGREADKNAGDTRQLNAGTALDKNAGDARQQEKVKILVIGNKDFQKQQVTRLGLSEECFCDSRTEDAGKWLMERTGGTGVDVFFECVGKNETLVQAVETTAPAGRICLVGNPASYMVLEQEVYWKILRNQQTIVGTWNSSFTGEATDDWHYVLERLSRNRIMPHMLISHRFLLEDLEKGFHIMRDKSEDYIKIIGMV